MRAIQLMVACVTVLVAMAGQTRAGLITINETIDIAGYTSDTFIFHTFPSPTQIGIGNSVDMTVNFANNLALQMGDGGEIFRAWLDNVGGSGSFTVQNIQLEFLGFQGTAGTSSTLNSASQSSGTVHLGPTFF